MKLIYYEDYEVKIADELLLIKPFRKMLLQDKSKHKERFLEKISYIFFMYNPSSNYSYLVDLEDRKKEIIAQEGLPAKFTPDALMKEAIEVYKALTITTASLVLETTRHSLEKVRKFLLDVDLTLVDDRKKPIYTINTITSALKMLPELAKELSNAEKALLADRDTNNNMRGSAVKKILEDGL